VPFVDDTKLLADPAMGMARYGSYGAVFVCGLTEFEDMGFALHLLTDEDLFGDIGANVGFYSVLASGVRGANQ
jgi:hypothetical protein